MTDINRNRAGLTLGVMFGVCHTLWIVAIAAGIGQTLLNWLHAFHFTSNAYTVTGFDPVIGILGVLGAVLSGYVTGWIFAYIYNYIGRKSNWD